MICSISGEPAKDPVLSPKSGRVFERTLIETYIAQNGTDPMSSPEASLSVDELIPIKTDTPVVPPRAPSLTSVPSLLSTLQNEWDALALETFSLRQQLKQARQELSTALYYQDASVRVVARLIKERDEARTSLAQLAASIGSAQPQLPQSQHEEAENSNKDQNQAEKSSTSPTISLPQSTAQSISEKRTELVAFRRKQRKTADAESATASDIVALKSKKKPTKQFFQGVQSFSIDPVSRKFLLTGGLGSKAGVFFGPNPSNQALFSSSVGIVTTTAWLSDSVFALGSKTNNIEIFKSTVSESSVQASSVSTLDLAPIDPQNNYSVVAIKVHPGLPLLVSLSATPSQSAVSTSFWAVHDISDPEAPKILAHSPPSHTFDTVYTSVDLHPDGALLALGTSSNTIEIYSLDTGAKAATISLPASYSAKAGGVAALSFSENGYWLASSYAKVSKAANGHGSDGDSSMEVDSEVDVAVTAFLWDLRASDPVPHTIKFSNLAAPNAFISRLAFDTSGRYLAAVAGVKVSVVGYVKAKKAWTTDEAGAAEIDGLENGALFTYASSYELADVAWGTGSKSLYIVTQKGSIGLFSV